MSVSVIIPTYNREAYLRRCLSSLRQSAVMPLETIVIDDDPKYDIQSFSKEFPEIRLIVARRGALLSEKRNIGAGASASDYLFFVDDDNEVGQQAIGELLEGFKDESIGVCVPVAYYLRSPGRVWSSTLNKGRGSPGFYDRS